MTKTRWLDFAMHEAHRREMIVQEFMPASQTPCEIFQRCPAFEFLR